MSKVNEIVEGRLNKIAQETIDENSIYIIDDAPQGGITNAQMLDALSLVNKGFYSKGEVYQCTDDGEYKKNHFYKFTGSVWEDTTPASMEGSYKSITWP